MTPKEFNQAYTGYMWSRERLLKDMGWMLSVIVNFCKQPTKSRKSYKTEDFVKVGTDKKNRANTFYRQILGIVDRRRRR